MAIKYCDHGAYSQAAEFQAQVNANGNTLTVTSILSGKLTLGMEIIGLPGVNFPWPVQVSAFGTGSGGTGTYTLSYASRAGAVSMSIFTGRGGGPSTTPAWGVPQDGDGLAKDPSPASATAHIVFTGTPSGSISVCGVTVSPTWGATADSAANGLATAINAATGAVTSGGFSFSPQLRSAVFARGPSAGAPAGTCQIMTRQGSYLFNGNVAIAHTLTNVNAGASSLNFSGGVSGCWGWLFNPAKMWPSAVTEFSYGLLAAATCYAGSVGPGDTVYIRSGKKIAWYTWSNGGTPDFLMPNMGTALQPVNLVVDDSTVWPDGPEPVLEWVLSATVPQASALPNMTAGYAALSARKYSDTKYGLRIYSAGFAAVGTIIFRIKSANTMQISGAHIECGPGGGAWQITANTSSLHTEGKQFSLSDSRLQQFSQTPFSWWLGAASNRTEANLNSVIFDCGTATAPQAPVMEPLAGAYSGVAVSLVGCRFLNFVVGSRLSSAVANPGKRIGQITARNTDFGNITQLGPFMSGSSYNVDTPSMPSVGWGIVSSNSTGGRDFFLDTPQGWCAWVSSRAFPTLNARLHDGVTPWSLQIIPTTATAGISAGSPFVSPRLAKINSLPTGVRTLTLNLGVEESLAWTRGDISLLVEYEDEDGIVRTIDSFDRDRAALTDSSAAWTNQSGGQFTYSESGVLYFNKKSISVTTPTPIKSGSEIGCYVRVHTPVADVTKQIFVDPEVVVA